MQERSLLHRPPPGVASSPSHRGPGRRAGLEGRGPGGRARGRPEPLLSERRSPASRGAAVTEKGLGPRCLIPAALPGGPRRQRRAVFGLGAQRFAPQRSGGGSRSGALETPLPSPAVCAPGRSCPRPRRPSIPCPGPGPPAPFGPKRATEKLRLSLKYSWRKKHQGPPRTGFCVPEHPAGGNAI